VRDDEAEEELSEEDTAGTRDSTADEVSVLIILFVSVISTKRSSILCPSIPSIDRSSGLRQVC